MPARRRKPLSRTQLKAMFWKLRESGKLVVAPRVVKIPGSRSRLQVVVVNPEEFFIPAYKHGFGRLPDLDTRWGQDEAATSVFNRSDAASYWTPGGEYAIENVLTIPPIPLPPRLRRKRRVQRKP